MVASVDEIINKKPLEAYEKKLWNKLLKKWAFCDRITITAKEVDMLLDEEFSLQQVEESKLSLFSSNEDNRIFKNDIIFILENEHIPDQYLFLLNENNESCRFIAFDEHRNMIFNAHIERKTNRISVDENYPIGFKLTKEQTDYMLRIHQVSEEELNKRINFVIKKLGNKYFSIMTSLVCYIQNTKVIKEVKRKSAITDSHLYKHNNSPHNQSSRRLTQVVYQYQQERKERNNMTYNRHTDSWEVRGHYRMMKNGKRIWIKPYVKGNRKDDKLKLGKDYKL